MFWKWEKIPSTLYINVESAVVKKNLNNEFEISWARGDNSGSSQKLLPDEEGVLHFEEKFQCPCTIYKSKSDHTIRQKNLKFVLKRFQKDGYKIYGKLTVDIAPYYNMNKPAEFSLEMESGRSNPPVLNVVIAFKPIEEKERADAPNEDEMSFIGETPEKITNLEDWDQTEADQFEFEEPPAEPVKKPVEKKPAEKKSGDKKKRKHKHKKDGDKKEKTHKSKGKKDEPKSEEGNEEEKPVDNKEEEKPANEKIEEKPEEKAAEVEKKENEEDLKEKDGEKKEETKTEEGDNESSQSSDEKHKQTEEELRKAEEREKEWEELERIRQEEEEKHRQEMEAEKLEREKRIEEAKEKLLAEKKAAQAEEAAFDKEFMEGQEVDEEAKRKALIDQMKKKKLDIIDEALSRVWPPYQRTAFLDKSQKVKVPSAVLPLYSVILFCDVLKNEEALEKFISKIDEAPLCDRCNAEQKFITLLLLLVNAKKSELPLAEEFVAKLTKITNAAFKAFLSPYLVPFEVILNRFATARFNMDNLIKDFNIALPSARSKLQSLLPLSIARASQRALLKLIDERLVMKLVSSPARFCFTNGVSWSSFCTALEGTTGISLAITIQFSHCLMMGSRIATDHTMMEEICPDISNKTALYIMKNTKPDENMPLAVDVTPFAKAKELDINCEPDQYVVSDFGDLVALGDGIAIDAWKKCTEDSVIIEMYPFIANFINQC